MHRNSDGPRLFGDGTVNRLPYPPGGIGAKFETAARVEFANGAQQSHVAFLDQIKEIDAAPKIALGNTDNQSQVGADQRLIGFYRAYLSRLNFLQQAFIRWQVAIERTLIGQALILVEVLEQPLRIL